MTIHYSRPKAGNGYFGIPRRNDRLVVAPRFLLPLSRGLVSTVRAFTLIELLVVIGIVAILIAVLFPVGIVAIERAKAGACAGNLQTLGTAVFVYAEENNNRLPFGYNWTPDAGLVVWTTLLSPYLPAGSMDTVGNHVLYCPSTSLSGTGNYLRNAATWCTDYSANYSAFRCYPSTQTARPSDCAATTILLYDGYSVGMLGAPADVPRHANGLNCLFADGRVEHLAALPQDPDSWLVPPP